MKKKSVLLLGLCFSFAVMAQSVFTFEKLEHDFGKIKEDSGKVSYKFVFTNTGDSALVITNVGTSCGCTVPDWPRNAIEPGEQGRISVSFSPKGRPGYFKKRISITKKNATEPVALFIKGEVLRSEEKSKK